MAQIGHLLDERQQLVRDAFGLLEPLGALRLVAAVRREDGLLGQLLHVCRARAQECSVAAQAGEAWDGPCRMGGPACMHISWRSEGKQAGL